MPLRWPMAGSAPASRASVPNAPGNAYGAYFLATPPATKLCVFCQLPEGA